MVRPGRDLGEVVIQACQLGGQVLVGSLGLGTGGDAVPAAHHRVLAPLGMQAGNDDLLEHGGATDTLRDVRHQVRAGGEAGKAQVEAVVLGNYVYACCSCKIVGGTTNLGVSVLQS